MTPRTRDKDFYKVSFKHKAKISALGLNFAIDLTPSPDEVKVIIIGASI